jgi:hypothetical protein
MFFPFRLRQKRKAKETRSSHHYEHTAELCPSFYSALERYQKNTPEEHVSGFKLERNNEFIFGSAAGMIGAMVKYGFNELMQVLNIARYDNNATSLTVVMKDYEYTPVYWAFGFVNALFIGAFFGLVIAFMFSYIFTERYYLLKGAGIGIGIWLFNFGFAAKVFNYPPSIQYSLGDIVSMLLSLIIYAMVTVYSLKKIGFWRSRK